MELKVPTLLSDITVKEFQKFHSVQSNEENDKDFLLYKTIEIFCGVDIQDVLKFPQEEAEKLSAEVLDVLAQPAEFKDRFELRGVEYGFIPNLEKLTLGEYIDLETYLTDTKDLHKAAAVMYRPIVKSYKELYTIEDYSGAKEYSEIMKDAPIDVISQAVVFFYLLGNELLMASQSFLEDNQKEILTTLEKLNLDESSVGSIPSTLSAMETLLNLKR